MTNTSTSGKAPTVVREHPVLAYFLLAFLISWGGIAALVLPGDLPKTSAELEALYLPVFLVMLCGPSIAGLAMTPLLDGRIGLRTLLRIFTTWRVGFGYYLFALVALVAPVIALIVLRAFSAFSPVFTPTVLGATGGVALTHAGYTASLMAHWPVGTSPWETMIWTGVFAATLLATATALTRSFPNKLVSA